MDYDRGKHSKVELFKTLISKFTDKTCIDLIRDIARFMPGDWAIMMPDMKPGCKVCVRMGKLAKMEEWGTLPKTLRR